MADAQRLKRFHVKEADEGFRLHIEDQAGNILELLASHEQIDLIADDLDDILSQDDSADEVEDDDDEDDFDDELVDEETGVSKKA